MEAMQTFMRVVEAEDFVQGHEVLEDLWRAWKNDPLKREESYILKGLINGSTALALIRLGRAQSSLRVWETFAKYRPLIETIPSPYTAFFHQSQHLLDAKYKALTC